MAHVRSLFFDGPLAEVENKALKAYALGRPSDVIWNITNRCNLLCDHCYMAADGHRARPAQRRGDHRARQPDGRARRAARVPVGRRADDAQQLLGDPRDGALLRHARHRLHERDAHRPRGGQAPQGQRRRLDRDLAVRPAAVPRRDGRRPRHQAKVIAAIKILREEGVGVALKSAVSKDTLPFIPHIIAKAKDLDCAPRVPVRPDHVGRSEGEEDARVSARAVAGARRLDPRRPARPGPNTEYDIGALPSMIPYLAEKLKAEGVDVSNGLERLELVSACPVGKGHMNINSEGGIMPCQFAQDWTVGNIRDMTLTEATQELYKLDAQDAKGICAPENCEYSRICRGCRTKAWQATGDPMFEDDTCLLKRLADGNGTSRATRTTSARRFRLPHRASHRAPAASYLYWDTRRVLKGGRVEQSFSVGLALRW